jgi:hypothetical protein
VIGFGKKGEPRYVALIGDIAGSRSLPNRAEIQDQLRELFLALNRDLPEGHLAAPLAFSAGDQFQALLHRPESAMEIIRWLADEMHPIRFHHGLGYGPLTTSLRSEVGFLDGPCFHSAREALERGTGQDRWVSSSGFGEDVVRQIDAIFRLMDAIRSGWTEKQNRYARHARTLPQKEVATLLEVSPSVVSESLKAARFEAVREGEEAARILLAPFGSRTESKRSSAGKAKSGEVAAKGKPRK